jgi:hypothetical protein
LQLRGNGFAVRLLQLMLQDSSVLGLRGEDNHELTAEVKSTAALPVFNSLVQQSAGTIVLHHIQGNYVALLTWDPSLLYTPDFGPSAHDAPPVADGRAQKRRKHAADGSNLGGDQDCDVTMEEAGGGP